VAIVKPPLTNPNVVEHITQVAQYVNEQPLTISSGGIPTAGSYKKGDLVYNSQPVAGGYIGWVCVTSGTFGTTSPTFKGFGVIQS